MNKQNGLKFDNNKTRMDLLQYDCIKDVADILTFGSIKYKEESWKHIENAENRYFAALMRHLVAYRNGESIDTESNMPHLSHAACNLMFLQWFEKNKSSINDKKTIGVNE